MMTRRSTIALLLAAALPIAGLPCTTSVRAQEDGQDVLDRPVLVNERAERAIEKGVAWLAKNQGHNGSWAVDRGWAAFPVCMTALAGMALLGHGDTPSRGCYSPHVRKALNYLLQMSRRSGRTGLITAPGEESRSMYGHGFATMFLAECLGSEGDAETEAQIKESLRRAIELTGRAQSRAGGWLYTPDMGGDEGSVTVTQVQALRACRNAGVAVPHVIVKNAVKYIEKSQCGDGGIAYNAGGGDSRPPISAAAVAVLYNAGEYDSPMARKCLQYCKRVINTADGGGAAGHYYYTHLYLAQAWWQVGGQPWNDYYPKIRDALCNRQGGDGSWEGDSIGKVYGTAIAITILTLPYEHVHIYSR